MTVIRTLYGQEITINVLTSYRHKIDKETDGIAWRDRPFYLAFMNTKHTNKTLRLHTDYT